MAAENSGVAYKHVGGCLTDMELVDELIKKAEIVYHQPAHTGLRAIVDELKCDQQV